MTNLALFDFDGTITRKDTFTDFLYFAVGRKRLLAGKVLLAPVILGYKSGIVPPGKAREIVAGFGFRGRKLEDLYGVGGHYARHVLPRYIRSKALRRIRWHQTNGDKVVVVSASLDFYLIHWCEHHDLELICSRFIAGHGRVKGTYDHGDCSGIEKASRIKKRYDLDTYSSVYAYGDTADDKEMLALADVQFYRWRRIDPSSNGMERE